MKIHCFLRGRICCATQAALSHNPAHASVSLAQGPYYDPSLENYLNFHNVNPLQRQIKKAP